MDATALQNKIDQAFRILSRPTSFTTCRCDECFLLDSVLQSKDYNTLAATDVGMSLCLISPEGMTYWIPALVRLCLTGDRDQWCEACDHFIKSELGLSLPKMDFPCQHPRFASLNPEQTALVLEFLKHIEASWYTKDRQEAPRELARAIRNWSRFAGVNLESKESTAKRDESI